MGLQFQDFKKRSLVAALDVGAAGFYLEDYMVALGASALVIEEHYVDRHYLADFAGYYARSFNPPLHRCARAHFFRGLTAAELRAHFVAAFESVDRRTEIERLLQDNYLGFAVVRPLATARLGRTVLKPYPHEGRRHYEVVRPYRINLAGLRLEIEGIAYQQQDRGAAVCASTALWVALQKVAQVVGHRSPTPTQITEAAASPYPASHGLDEAQMARALSELGYIADKFAPLENRALFRTLLASTLKSHLPAILLIGRTMETGAGQVEVGHAVTVTGYSEPDGIVPVPASDPHTPPLASKSGSLGVIYVHDDNLGFHAHYELRDSTDVDAAGHAKLKLFRGSSTAPAVDWWTPDEWDVYAALVPKPPKLRLPIDDLFRALFDVRGLVEAVFAGLDLHYDARFSSGVDFKRGLIDDGFEPPRLADFQAKADLPRHIGVLTVLTARIKLCDIIIDVTEIGRNVSPSVLAIVAAGVPADSAPGLHIAQICTAKRWHVLLGRPSGRLAPSHPLATP